MCKFCNFLPVFFLLMLAFSALPQRAQAQTVLQERITQPIESASSVPLIGSIHPLARIEFDTGLVDNAKVLQGMTINFKRTAAQEASLQALLAAQQEPSSPSYHQWLTPAQFGQQFGLSAADLAQVSAWLQQEGFTVTSTAQRGNAISFSGSVASVERTFQTLIHNYTVNGETHYANSTPISIPSALGGLVNSVRGLDNFRLTSVGGTEFMGDGTAAAPQTGAYWNSNGTGGVAGGDAYNTDSSGSTTVAVSNPGITLSATNMTISSPSPGHSGTSTITLTSSGGYAGTAVVSASSASLAADYEFGTASAQTASILLPAGGTGTTTMTIETIAAGGDVRTGPAGKLAPRRIAAAGGAGCLLLLLIPAIRKKRWPAALVMLVFLSIGAGLGCGGTGGASPAGTYTVTVTAADSSNAKITGSTTFTVTIE